MRISWVFHLLHILDHLVSKRRIVVLSTGAMPDDQGLALIERIYLLSPGWSVYWLVDDPVSARACYARLTGGGRLHFVKRQSLTAMRLYVRARVVFMTHGLFGSFNPPASKCVVNVWHGMPVKRIGGRRVGATWTLATADFWAAELATAFQQNPSSVMVTGLPRNDRMIAASRRKRDSDRPLVVWMPTYRTAGSSVEGVDYGVVTQLPGADLASLESLATDLEVDIVVKIHPEAQMCDAPLTSPSRVVLMAGDLLPSHTMSLYELLGHADVLITDYSSCWVDFLLLERPIVFATPDLEEYSTSRGFTRREIAENLPGPVVRDVDELKTALGEALNQPDAYREQLRRARIKHHAFSDGGSTDRVLALTPIAQS